MKKQRTNVWTIVVLFSLAISLKDIHNADVKTLFGR